MPEPTLLSRVEGSAQLRRRQGLARAISAGLGQVHVAGRRPPAVLLFGEPIRTDRWPDGQVLKRGVAAAAAEGIRVALAALVSCADELRADRGRSRANTTTERARD